MTNVVSSQSEVADQHNHERLMWDGYTPRRGALSRWREEKMRRNANGQKRNDRKLSSLALARQQWEQEQERLHGCKYVNGICTVHHGSTTDTASEGVGTEATGFICTCRAFSYPHHPKLHDTLAGRFPGDTEKQRFDDAAATDWRTPEEREAAGEGTRRKAEPREGQHSK